VILRHAVDRGELKIIKGVIEQFCERIHFIV
jgi:hypothetical protein